MKTLTKAQVFQHMADNARNGKSPVDGLQAKSETVEWIDAPESIYVGELVSGYFEFRVKPRTHTLNGYEVPAPEMEAPKHGAKYWFLNLWYEDAVISTHWSGTNGDKNAIRNGLWLSKEDAIANAKAMRGEDPYE